MKLQKCCSCQAVGATASHENVPWQSPEALFLLTGVFTATKAALTSPLPHVYQADTQGNSVPVIPPDELRQEAAVNMQSGNAGQAGSVKVAELDQISRYHVSITCHPCDKTAPV